MRSGGGAFRDNILSPSSQFGLLKSSGPDSGGEKKYSPQLSSGSRDVKRILCEGLWYLMEDTCGHRTISVRNDKTLPDVVGASREK